MEFQLIVGLGNPGAKYRLTRHNAGFLALDLLCRKLRGKWKTHTGYQLGRLNIRGEMVDILKPMTFMNRSGDIVLRHISKCGLSPQNMLILHDDLDIPLGRIKIKRNGGTGGHRGLDSIVQSIQKSDFTRVRIGIGRDVPIDDVVTYVLSAPESPDDIALFSSGVRTAVRAVETILYQGTVVAMNSFNQKRRKDDSVESNSRT